MTPEASLSPEKKNAIRKGARTIILSYQTALKKCLPGNARVCSSEAEFKGAGCRAERLIKHFFIYIIFGAIPLGSLCKLVQNFDLCFSLFLSRFFTFSCPVVFVPLEGCGQLISPEVP